MHEADVALTDFALAVECAVLAAVAARRLVPGSYRTWVLTFFVSIAAGALCGGMAHAWFYGSSGAAQAVWVATMLAVGVTALACWNLGAEVWGKKWRGLRIAVAVQFGLYAAFVLAGARAYKFVIADYLPAALFLLVAGVVVRRWMLVAGLALTFAAAAIQVLRVDAPGISHNALYHVVQAVALVGVFLGLKAPGLKPEPLGACSPG